MEILDYTTAGGKNLIIDYIDHLSAATKAEILATRQLIVELGTEAFFLLNTRQLHKKLWEIKVSQERIMYVIPDDERVYFLNICKKQKGRAEKKEIDKAKRRAKAAGIL